MPDSGWVMLVYRLPREPSTPRITLWRKLRRLGAAQIMDGVVALPGGRDNRERLEWLADEAVQAGGEASIWLSEPATVAEERALVESMTERVEAEYAAIAAEAQAARRRPPAERRRIVARLRRELRRVGARTYFPTPAADTAGRAVDALAATMSEAAA